MATNSVRIDPGDNVAVAIREIKSGETVTGVPGVEVRAAEDILRNHKVALVEIPESAPVIKYGEPIALSSRTIRAGEWVHTHNLKPLGS
jgi:altronate hydrolase